MRSAYPVFLSLDKQHPRILRERNQLILPPVRVPNKRVAPEDQVLIGRVHARPGRTPSSEAPPTHRTDARVRVVEEVVERRRPLVQLLFARSGFAAVLAEGEDRVGASQPVHEMHKALLVDVTAASVREDYLRRDGKDVKDAEAPMTFRLLDFFFRRWPLAAPAFLAFSRGFFRGVAERDTIGKGLSGRHIVISLWVLTTVQYLKRFCWNWWTVLDLLDHCRVHYKRIHYCSVRNNVILLNTERRNCCGIENWDVDYAPEISLYRGKAT